MSIKAFASTVLIENSDHVHVVARDKIMEISGLDYFTNAEKDTEIYHRNQ